MARRPLPRRKRLILRYTTLSLALLLLGSAVFLLTRRAERPYRAGEAVEGITDSLGRSVPADYPRVRFQDVASEVGIRSQHFWQSRSTQLPEDMGSGAAWGDYDGDGSLDVYICNVAGPLTLSDRERAASPVSNKLYRQRSDGTFEDVSAAAGVDYRGISMGAAWADYDGDEDLDLVVTSFGPILLYRNNGDGTFSDQSQESGLGRERGFWSGASWGDYDRDGDLDLYVCGYVRYHFDPADLGKTALQYSGVVPFTLNPSSYSPQRNLLFQNEGNGRFIEVAGKLGVDNPEGRSLSAAWSDFNLDGWLDLYVANDISDNVMYQNLGEGKFVDISHAAWVADYRGAMGLAVGDWDNDRDFDVFVTHWIAQENALLNNLIYAFDNRDSRAAKLLFMDIADQVGLGEIGLDYVGWGTSFFDYDNDGRADLFVVNGSTFQKDEDPASLLPMRDLLFWNKGEEDGFFEVGAVSGDVFKQERVGRGAAFADYDDDGDVDVLVVNQAGPVQLLRNEGGNSSNWLKVRLHSSSRNHFGLGAIIQLTAGGKRQTQQLNAQPSYLSQGPAEAHFGLGALTVAEKVVVTFPSGRTVTREQVAANQTIVIESP
ncbi:MAG: FG-GAP-like repeat-containing protein [Acidobacteriota bacterium]